MPAGELLPIPTTHTLTPGETRLFLKGPLKIGDTTITDFTMPDASHKTDNGEGSFTLAFRRKAPEGKKGALFYRETLNPGEDQMIDDSFAGIRYTDAEGHRFLIDKKDISFEPPVTPGTEPVIAEEIAKREVISIVGVSARGQEAVRLAGEDMDKSRDIWKKSFQEYFEERRRQYYNRMLETAQAPFAEDAIRKAEQLAKERWEQELADLRGPARWARKAWDTIVDHTVGRSKVDEYALDILATQRDTLMQDTAKAFDREKDELARRFETDYIKQSDVVREQMGERMLVLKPENPEHQAILDGITGIINEYRTGAINDSQLQEKLHRFYGQTMSEHAPDILTDIDAYASSLTDIAKEQRFRLEQGEAVGDLDAELANMEIRLAIGKMGTATDLTPTATRKWVERIRATTEHWQKKDLVHQVVFNDTTVSTAVSLAIALGNLPVRSLASAQAKLLLGAAGGGGVSAIMGGMREFRRRQKDLRRFWAQKEAGVVSPEDAKMRAWYEQFDMKPRSVADMTEKMTAGLYMPDGFTMKAEPTVAELRASMAELADARARWDISSREKNRIGLVNIGAIGEQERNRTILMRTMTKVQRDLSYYCAANADNADIKAMLGDQSFDEFFSGMVTTQTAVIEHGKAALDQLGADSAMKLALDPLSGYAPEQEYVKKKFLVFGEKRREASGIDAIMKEFRNQAIVESAKHGIIRGTVGAGIGALVNEAVVDVRDLWQYHTLTGTGAIGSTLRSAYEGIGKFAFHKDWAILNVNPDGIKIDPLHHVMLGNGMSLDEHGNLDIRTGIGGGKVMEDVIPDFKSHVVMTDHGMVLDDFAKEHLRAAGMAHAETNMELLPPDSPVVHTVSIGGRDFTMPEAMHVETNPDGTGKIVFNMVDEAHRTVPVTFADHVPMHDGQLDASVLETLRNQPEFFHVLTPVSATFESHAVPIPGMEFVGEHGMGYAPTLDIPAGTHLTQVSEGVYAIVRNSDNTHLLDNIHIGHDGAITNVAEIHRALPEHWSLNEMSSDKFVSTETLGPVTGERAIHFLPGADTADPSGIGERGTWEWFERHTSGETFGHPTAATNAMLKLERAWLLHEADPARDITWDGDAHTIPFHTTTQGNEVWLNALPNNAVLHVPNALFSDGSLANIGHLSDKAIAMYEAKLAEGTMSPVDVLHWVDQQDHAMGIVLKAGFFGREQDMPTGDEVRFLADYLAKAPPPVTTETVIRHFAFVQESPAGLVGHIEIDPGAALNMTLLTANEEPYGFIPILPVTQTTRLEAVTQQVVTPSGPPSGPRVVLTPPTPPSAGPVTPRKLPTRKPRVPAEPVAAEEPPAPVPVPEVRRNRSGDALNDLLTPMHTDFAGHDAEFAVFQTNVDRMTRGLATTRQMTVLNDIVTQTADIPSFITTDEAKARFEAFRSGVHARMAEIHRSGVAYPEGYVPPAPRTEAPPAPEPTALSPFGQDLSDHLQWFGADDAFNAPFVEIAKRFTAGQTPEATGQLLDQLAEAVRTARASSERLSFEQRRILDDIEFRYIPTGREDLAAVTPVPAEATGAPVRSRLSQDLEETMMRRFDRALAPEQVSIIQVELQAITVNIDISVEIAHLTRVAEVVRPIAEGYGEGPRRRGMETFLRRLDARIERLKIEQEARTAPEPVQVPVKPFTETFRATVSTSGDAVETTGKSELTDIVARYEAAETPDDEFTALSELYAKASGLPQNDTTETMLAVIRVQAEQLVNNNERLEHTLGWAAMKPGMESAPVPEPVAEVPFAAKLHERVARAKYLTDAQRKFILDRIDSLGNLAPDAELARIGEISAEIAGLSEQATQERQRDVMGKIISKLGDRWAELKSPPIAEETVLTEAPTNTPQPTEGLDAAPKAQFRDDIFTLFEKQLRKLGAEHKAAFGELTANYAESMTPKAELALLQQLHDRAAQRVLQEGDGKQKDMLYRIRDIADSRIQKLKKAQQETAPKQRTEGKRREESIPASTETPDLATFRSRLEAALTEDGDARATALAKLHGEVQMAIGGLYTGSEIAANADALADAMQKIVDEIERSQTPGMTQ